MISEHQFVRKYRSYWHELLPGMEFYLRRLNGQCQPYTTPLPRITESSDASLCNEAGFILAHSIFDSFKTRSSQFSLWYAPSSLSLLTVHQYTKDEVVSALRQSYEEMEQYRSFRKLLKPFDPSEVQVRDVINLSKNLLEWVRKQSDASSLVFRPKFTGCGWISNCEGDLSGKSWIGEVKAGDRHFRSDDLLQLLVYVSLVYADCGQIVQTLKLINPRHGIQVAFSCSEFIESSSLSNSNEVLERIIDRLVGEEDY